jgi:hypothetical protein
MDFRSAGLSPTCGPLVEDGDLREVGAHRDPLRQGGEVEAVEQVRPDEVDGVLHGGDAGEVGDGAVVEECGVAELDHRDDAEGVRDGPGVVLVPFAGLPQQLTGGRRRPSGRTTSTSTPDRRCRGSGSRNLVSSSNHAFAAAVGCRVSGS